MVIHHVGIHHGDTAVNGDTTVSPFPEMFSAILNHIIGHSELDCHTNIQSTEYKQRFLPRQSLCLPSALVLSDALDRFVQNNTCLEIDYKNIFWIFLAP